MMKYAHLGSSTQYILLLMPPALQLVLPDHKYAVKDFFSLRVT